MTVRKVKQLLQDAIEILDNYEDDKEVKMVSNTYFLGHPYCFLGISGYDGGYIDLDEPVDETDDDEDDEW